MAAQQPGPGSVATKAVLARVRAALGKKPRLPKGFGTITIKVNAHGYVTFLPRLTRDGIDHWGEGVGIQRVPGLSWERCVRRAWDRADQHRRRLVCQVDSSQYVETGQRKTSLARVVDDWWRAIEGSDRAEATKTRRAEFLAIIRQHIGTTLPRRLSAVRPEHLEKLAAVLREEPVRPKLRDGTLGPPRARGTSTIRGVHDQVVQILRWASKRRMPVFGGLLVGAAERPGHTPKETRSLDVAEALRLITEMKDDHPFGALVATEYFQGLRDSEGSGLKWKDVGPDGIDVVRKRGKRSRTESDPKWRSKVWVPMLPQTKTVLDEHRQWCQASGYPTGPDDWVFGHRRNAKAPVRPPLYDTTLTHIKAACQRAGLPSDVAADSLRRGFSDAAKQAGVGITDLAEMLRNDPAVALRYPKPDKELLRREARKISRVMERAAGGG